MVAEFERAVGLYDQSRVFADGVEQDFLPFDWGRRVRLRPAPETLNLVTG